MHLLVAVRRRSWELVCPSISNPPPRRHLCTESTDALPGLAKSTRTMDLAFASIRAEALVQRLFEPCFVGLRKPADSSSPRDLSPGRSAHAEYVRTRRGRAWHIRTPQNARSPLTRIPKCKNAQDVSPVRPGAIDWRRFVEERRCPLVSAHRMDAGVRHPNAGHGRGSRGSGNHGLPGHGRH